MTAEAYKEAIKQLTQIPGVERSVADDLIQMGVTSTADLKNKNAEKLYSKSNRQCGTVQDRKLLYVFRCAIYYASTEVHDKEKLKWQSWKDK
jgi:hypothetical protein